MSRPEAERLLDIVAACQAIREYVALEDADERIVFDAIRMRLIEIGEAVKDLDPGMRAREPGIPWAQMAGMRDILAHRYFDTTHSVVMGTARQDAPVIEAAARRLLGR
ncbi:hypothetical protein AX769_00285 [Frondihabitans sp. PAMC 28766]|uniref:HepT-like ribonuclease domain-containing protein n=1 Tax=Frondihabitans sp. PAMC 28766 TaxID=1795630 RepID=UPI00078D8949|nr:HepT-like ribonuclease domain-containing protein [Frondihabitans sp. PAMC 28766]AMM18861.1 hypothetical protein AX769_00285 [Frondihabitans sp. PAMC 28766]